MATKFNTGKVRFSYPNVFKPRASAEGAEPKYSMTALLPKSDKATLDKLSAACKEIYEENKGKGQAFYNLNYDEVQKPFHDGDGRKPKGGAYGDECKGCIVLNMSSKNKPIVVDGQRNPVTDELSVYPGCYGRVNVGLYVYNVSGNKGIACGLNGVQTFGYGQAIGGGCSAGDFDDGFSDDAADEEFEL
jgi:hypothetical protein